ncbi:MAG TPA: trypsin-like serine protease, partial [Methylomirabilota bacterium]|nr:trypsin-like serine protease [Methylomirabilota bacterium]
MRKRLMLTLAAMVACLVVASPVQAVTGNYSRDFAHDYVGLLVFYTTPDPVTGDPFSHRCSGSLISPTIIVTAGHCTAGVDEGRVYFQQSVAPNYDPDAFGGWGGDETTGYPYENGIT